MLGHPEWREDPRFADNSARMRNLTSLTEAMNAVLATRDRDEWMAAFDAAGVPAGPVNTIGEALTHPQAAAQGMVVEVTHPQAGATKALGCPVHFSATPAVPPRAAPLLGQHTREVLREHGYDEEEIARFSADGVIEAV